MPPSYNSNAAAHGFNIPNRFRCYICERWKGNIEFSKNELKKYSHSNAIGGHVTTITAKLRCRSCVGGPALEQECEGACGMTLPLEAFSKSARKAGGSGMCKNCVLWKESAEYGVVVIRPPGELDTPTIVDPDFNTRNSSHQYAGLKDGDNFSDPEAGESGSDFGDTQSISVPRCGSSSSITSSTDTGAIPPPVRLPYKPFEKLQLTTAASTVSGLGSGSTLAFGQDTPQHMRDHSTSLSASASNLYEDSTSSASNRFENESIASTSTATRDRPTYNAWDSSGQRHILTASRSPEVLPIAPTPKTSKSGWVKRTGFRNTQRIHEQENSLFPYRKSSFASDSDIEDDLIEI